MFGMVIEIFLQDRANLAPPRILEGLQTLPAAHRGCKSSAAVVSDGIGIERKDLEPRQSPPALACEESSTVLGFDTASPLAVGWAAVFPKLPRPNGAVQLGSLVLPSLQSAVDRDVVPPPQDTPHPVAGGILSPSC